MKLKRKYIVIIIVLIILLIPRVSRYKEGGTRVYSSLTYKIIEWHPDGQDLGTYVYIFPYNFHDLDYYYNLEFDKIE